jgi:hypothetical protein
MPIVDNVSLLVFLAVGLIIPFLVDLVTHKLASGALKQTVTLALALSSGVLGEFSVAHASNADFNWQTAGYGALTTFITGVAVYRGLNQTKAIGSEGIINKLIPGGLIGSAPVTPVTPVVEAAPVVLPSEATPEEAIAHPLDSILAEGI